MKLAQPWYTQTQLSVFFSRTPATIVRKIMAGEFGREVIKDGKDFLVPQSGYDLYVRSRGVFPDETSVPIRARTEGEARRKHRDFSGQFKALHAVVDNTLEQSRPISEPGRPARAGANGNAARTSKSAIAPAFEAPLSNSIGLVGESHLPTQPTPA